ncbi:MAG: alpha-2-macroglobulin family protein, partial [Pseudomonadota bacterium]
MRPMPNACRLLCCLLLLAPLAALAQPLPDRRMIAEENTDFFGGDLRSIFDTSADLCVASCLAEAECAAITYNQRASACFLKSNIGDRVPFDGAVSMRVAVPSADARSLAARRLADIALPPARLAAAVDRAARLGRLYPDRGVGVADLRAGLATAGTGALDRALAVTALSDAAGDWLRVAELALARQKTGTNADRRAARRLAQDAALNAYLRAVPDAVAATALNTLASGWEADGAGRATIAILRHSQTLSPRQETAAALTRAIGLYGFRVTALRVESDLALPRVCIAFSEPLLGRHFDYAPYVQLPPGDLAVEAEDRALCVTGATHGSRLALTLRQGLPARSGEVLAASVEQSAYIRDRAPAVRFPGRGYVLARQSGATLPVVTVNADRLDVTIRRVLDRNLAAALRDDLVGAPLRAWEAERLGRDLGETVWTGTAETAGPLNQDVTTALPLGDALTAFLPGVYAMTVSVPGAEALPATQWFIVTDLGLSVLTGRDGVHAFLHGLGDATPRAGVDVSLVARNNAVLATRVTDAAGYARFPASLARGTGGAAPALLVAETGEDYAFLDLTEAPFDLSDRGVEGRAAPGPIDVFATPERGAYRPGETVFTTILMRDAAAHGIVGVPLTAIVRRPDGVEHLRRVLADAGAGGRVMALALPPAAQRGRWRIALHLTPQAPALTEVAFLVEDFVPERIDFEMALAADAGDLRPGGAASVTVAARYLYGAVGAGLSIEGETVLRPANTRAGYPGFRFGPHDADPAPRIATLEDAGLSTDAEGRATLALPLATVDDPRTPLALTAILRLADSSRRPVERQVTQALTPAHPLIGVRPLFDGVVPEGGTARFEVLALAPRPGVRDASSPGGARIAPGKDEPLPALGRDAALPAPGLGGGPTDPEVGGALAAEGAQGAPTAEAVKGAMGVAGAADNALARIALDPVQWTLSRIITEYQWYEVGGRWQYEPITRRERVAEGRLALQTSALGEIAAPVNWGRYELTLQAETGGAYPLTSLRFSAGWFGATAASETPDRLAVALDKNRYAVGDSAALRVEAAAAGTLLITVIGDGVIAQKTETVPRGARTVILPVTEAWRPGAYVTATLIQPGAAAGRGPRRAVGLAWAPLDPGPRTLSGELLLPETAAPRAPLDIVLKTTARPEGERVFATIAVVDRGILNLTGFDVPDPARHYLGQRRLGVEMRDLYGRLIDGRAGRVGALRSGGDGGGGGLGPPPNEDLVALFSGPLEVGAEGSVAARFDLPDFNGRLTVMAILWSESGVAAASADVTVRDPVVMTASMPRFLAPGDRAALRLDLAHVGGAAGAMTLRVTGDAVLPLDDARSVSLDAGGRAAVTIPLEAGATGDAALRVGLTLPGGRVLTKDLTLGIRRNDPVLARQNRIALRPGDAMTLGPEVFAGLASDTATAVFSAGPLARFDVAGLLAALDAYPFGCTEQIISRALPLLTHEDVAAALDRARAPALGDRMARAIGGVLANQGRNGGFGLWSAFGTDGLWLDAYATDFLRRAEAAGHAVPAPAMAAAVAQLENRVNAAPDFEAGGEGLAYALYVLAGAGRAAIGDLRYYADAKEADFATPLARAHLGAALAAYGDPRRADALFRAAARGLEAGDGGDRRWRDDFGTPARDRAAVLTLAAEAGSEAIDLDRLATRIAADSARPHASPQERVWTLLAARALRRDGPSLDLLRDGAPVPQPGIVRLTAADLTQAPVLFRNAGAEPVQTVLTVFGQPTQPEPAQGNGYQITRQYFDLDGQPVDSTRVPLGTRLVAVLTVRPERDRAARLMVEDPLPAGFEIESPTLLASGDVAALAWLA